MSDQIVPLLEGLRADLAPTGLSPAPGVFDLAEDRWLTDQFGEKPQGFGHEGLVLVLPGRQHLIPDTEDGSADLRAIVSEVCDWAVDELGHGWPELYEEAGAFVGLLEPVREGPRVVWAVESRRVPIGALADELIALPPQWDGSRA